MADIMSYRDLQCWQQAMDLAVLVYRVTSKYPRHEQFGLTFHTRKTAVSVPSNIAEGSRRRRAGYVARLTDAIAEHAELETQMLIAERLGYAPSDDIKRFFDVSGSVGRLTHGLLRSLDRHLASPTP
jgi:four helix bundle protein